ncbi:formimidoylglutamate deiminase [Acidipropionibacterium timonense]|uniref:formimidoylglutamate deiminase n=1 Tax=Acidipropionibacterium timonense TaxID=2161818 RepID=UPI00102FDA05|nr:formimidoylglutamate deiminase [Acidipropionibacterium timonense]
MILCRTALVDGQFVDDVAVGVDDRGFISEILTGEPITTAYDVDGVVVPGFVNTHSHLFHRALRGAGEGEDFWSWRTEMYRLAGRLDPDGYHRLAIGVFGEMLDAGYTSVGEFHYVHHRPDGRPYPGHEMELAVAWAAIEAGIRLTLLDTCYLHAGFGAPLEPAQVRFGDGSAEGWVDRWHRLADALPRSPLVSLGAAVHSVRAVSPEEMDAAVDGLPDDVPLHVHLSEQPAENRACQQATGLTPTAVLERAGVLSPRTTAVHATHLTDDDIDALAASRTTVSLCPTTEADLGDGIARVADLLDAGVALCIGTDEDVVTDPFAELRLLESGARLIGGRRGVVPSEELWAIGSRVSSLLPGVGRAERAGLRVGDPADMVAVSPRSSRLAGVPPQRWPLVASAADVTATIVGGRVVPGGSTRRLVAALDELRGLPAELRGEHPELRGDGR